MTHEPKTLVEAVRYFADPETTLKMIIELRWPDGVTCPTCGSERVRFVSTRRIWECKNKHPKRQFSGKIGTIFEDFPLPRQVVRCHLGDCQLQERHQLLRAAPRA